MKRRAAVYVSLVIIALAALGWSRIRPGPGELVFSGVVEATAYDQGFELSGTIQEIPVKEGDRVTHGSLLARLDPAVWEAAERQAAARLETARARLLEARNGPRKAEIRQARARLEQSRAELEQALNGATRAELDAARAGMQAAHQRYLREADGYRQEDVNTGKTQLEAARVNLTTLDTDYRRYLRLHQEGAVPDQLLEARKNQYLQALRAFQAAQENVKKLTAGPRTEEKQAALEDYRSAEARYRDLANGTRPEAVRRARAQLAERQQALRLLEEGTRPEQIQAAREQVKEAEGALEQARVNLRRTRLEAATEAVVVTRNLEPGDTVAATTPVISLADLAHPWVYIYIPEPELAKVKLNARARVRADSLGGQVLPGRVTRIYERAEFTPKTIQTTRERVNLVFRARVEVENPELRLRPGMPADVEVAP